VQVLLSVCLEHRTPFSAINQAGEFLLQKAIHEELSLLQNLALKFVTKETEKVNEGD
jgi:hypothetical protein